MNPNNTTQNQYQQPQVVYQQKNSNKSVWIVILVVVLVICAVCAICGAINGASFMKGFNEALNSAMSASNNSSEVSTSLTNTLKSTISQLNSETPQMLSNDLRWDSTSTFGNVLQYNYTLVNYDKSEINSTFESTTKTNLVDYIKTSTDMNTLKSLGVQFNYNYRDKNGTTVALIEVKPVDYK